MSLRLQKPSSGPPGSAMLRLAQCTAPESSLVHGAGPASTQVPEAHTSDAVPAEICAGVPLMTEVTAPDPLVVCLKLHTRS
jgi:hypothetical protein